MLGAIDPRIGGRCVSEDPPCFDFRCEVCLQKNFGDWKLAEDLQLSPTQPCVLDGAARSLQPTQREGQYHTQEMSCSDGSRPHIVVDEEEADPAEVDNEEEAAAAPKTPKRQGHEGDRIESPAKTRNAGEAGPTNADFLAYMKHVMESNSR